MIATDNTINICNELLRGEISAVETYTQAIVKFSGDSEMLRRIRSDHEENVTVLRQLIMENGGEPAGGSGAWGGFVMALEGAAKLMGESTALRILEEGEQHGMRKYRDALAGPEVSEDAKRLIRDELLPSIADHLLELQRRRAGIAQGVEKV